MVVLECSHGWFHRYVGLESYGGPVTPCLLTDTSV